ncbi:DUF4339 domain-containing protein [Candidatus Methylacidiphilum infernorum]|uniref:GYF domain-containing protein n=1 Tax=Methylacidiphilum infernorum (isolate V4) TaxID=481448 RepID=B3DVT0_METI4|nr:DUF4339 domain-containing protein [Candidatus Methylacidiphilum infernorum]ACD83433.1 Hypothetical protein Minf_1379 [Methylacidiphilum infernorum V4]
MEIFIVLSGKKEGPYSMEEVLQLLEKGTINTQTLAWRKGLKDWEPLGKLIQEVQEAEQKGSSPGEEKNVQKEEPVTQGEIPGKEPKTDPLIQLLKASEQVEAWMGQELANFGLQVSPTKSHPLEPKVWLEYHLEFPHPNSQEITARSSALFQFLYTPFRQFEQEVRLSLSIMGQTKRFCVVDLTQEHVKQIVKTLLLKFPDPSSPFSLCHFHQKRAFPWQLWLTPNKITRIQPINTVNWARLLWIIGLLFIPYYGVGFLILLSGWFLYQSAFHNGYYVIRSAWPSFAPLIPKNLILRSLVLRSKATELSQIKEFLEKEYAQKLSPSVEPLPPDYTFFLHRQNRIYYKRDQSFGFIELAPQKEDLRLTVAAYENSGAWKEKAIGYGKDLLTHSFCVLVEPKETIKTGDLQKSALEAYTFAHSLYIHVVQAIEKLYERPILSLDVYQDCDFQKYEVNKETSLVDLLKSGSRWIFPL